MSDETKLTAVIDALAMEFGHTEDCWADSGCNPDADDVPCQAHVEHLRYITKRLAKEGLLR